MALSGKITGTCDNTHYTLTCEWSAVQNIANNTSTITAKIYLNGNGYATDSDYWDCTINGVQVTNDKDLSFCPRRGLHDRRFGCDLVESRFSQT